MLQQAFLRKELAATLRRKFRVPAADIPWLDEYRTRANLVRPAPLPAPVCRDANDDWVLAAAVAPKADSIVTGDIDPLVVRAHAGIPILSPRQFPERIDRLK